MPKTFDRVRVAKAFKALAHPSRLAAVEALSKGPRCVCELREIMGSDLSTVSRHLKLLTEAGLFSSARQGQKIFYRLTAPCVTGFLECLNGMLDGKPCRLVTGPAAARRK